MGFFSIFNKDSILYFPGCMTYFKHKKIFELYKKVFSKLEINFITFDSYISSGLEAWELGYDSLARDLARKNLEVFSKNGIKKLITNSPGDYMLFSQKYSNMIPNWKIKTLNLWELILERLRKKPGLIKNFKNEIVTYHDCCYMGRYSGIYNEPREILKLLGYKIREMDNSKENSFCCGSCGGLTFSNPSLANKIAKERILQAKRIGIKKIIVSSMENYDLLRKNIGDTNIEIIELSQILADSLGIKSMELEEKIEGEEVLLDLEN